MHAIYLAILQGFTEFLPISSSGHLILIPSMMGWEDQGLAFDVAVHVGTLTAVMWYFRTEIVNMTADWFDSIAKRQLVGESKLAWAVLWGTVPVGLAGLLFHDFIDTQLRSPLVIAWATIGFGLLQQVHGHFPRQSFTAMPILHNDRPEQSKSSRGSLQAPGGDQIITVVNGTEIH